VHGTIQRRQHFDAKLVMMIILRRLVVTSLETLPATRRRFWRLEGRVHRRVIGTDGFVWIGHKEPFRDAFMGLRQLWDRLTPVERMTDPRRARTDALLQQRRRLRTGTAALHLQLHVIRRGIAKNRQRVLVHHVAEADFHAGDAIACTITIFF